MKNQITQKIINVTGTTPDPDDDGDAFDKFMADLDDEMYLRLEAALDGLRDRYPQLSFWLVE